MRGDGRCDARRETRDDAGAVCDCRASSSRVVSRVSRRRARVDARTTRPTRAPHSRVGGGTVLSHDRSNVSARTHARESGVIADARRASRVRRERPTHHRARARRGAIFPSPDRSSRPSRATDASWLLARALHARAVPNHRSSSMPTFDARVGRSTKPAPSPRRGGIVRSPPARVSASRATRRYDRDRDGRAREREKRRASSSIVATTTATTRDDDGTARTDVVEVHSRRSTLPSVVVRVAR